MEDRRFLVRIILFLALSGIDVAFNAAAGPAAVAAGANVNGSDLTGRALRLGALAGATKSGVLAFVKFLSFANLNIASTLLLVMVASVFGVSVLVVAQVSNEIWGDTPSQLLIASLVAALPLQWEGVSMYLTPDDFNAPDTSGGARSTFQPGSAISAWIGHIGMDALGGYTFARMAENQNFPICSLGAAAAAGGVYGVLSGIPRVINYIAWGCFYRFEVE